MSWFACLAVLLPASLPWVSAMAQHVGPQDVVWMSLGQDDRDSMPIGNGDIGANVWTEANGDVVLLLGKTDAYTENGELVKLGRVRVQTSPGLFLGSGFTQTLKVRDGELEILGGMGARMRIWVDANHPVIHVELESSTPESIRATVELWRVAPRETRQGGVELAGRAVLRELNNIPSQSVTIESDTVLPASRNEVMWGHHNTRSIYPLVLHNQHLESIEGKYPDPLLHRAFGAAMRGDGMVSESKQILKSSSPQTRARVDIYELTGRAETMEKWAQSLQTLVLKESMVDRKQALEAHHAWWREFWGRSWIEAGGGPGTAEVTQGYAMQRYMDAVGGRGAIPIKYNGSIFTVGHEPQAGNYDPSKGQHDPDYRDWGSNFWLQNTRLVYWPMIAAGDDDLLAPFFKMYADDLPLEKDRNRIYFHQPGASYPETMYFWGTPGNGDFGWGNPSGVMRNTWIRYYVAGGLEVTEMMLDRYAQRPQRDFLEETLLPVADAVTLYYDNHWHRQDGKIHMDPAQAIETRQQAVNPTPDLAALKSILPKLMALPSTTQEERARWQAMLMDLPAIPTGLTAANGKIPDMDQESAKGKRVILPAERYSKTANSENAELYTVFPYQLYGVGLPGLDLARDTYDARVFKSSTCWGQDGMEVAILGWADRAKAEAIANFTAYGGERFKWFWKMGHDWEPDMDNGGAGMSILQLMLLQTRGDKMLLFPAWPTDWDVRFKLHAPKNTTVEGIYEKGRLMKLQVLPASRAKDIVQMLPQ